MAGIKWVLGKSSWDVSRINCKPHLSLLIRPSAAFASKDSWVQFLKQAGLRLRVHPEDTGPGADLSAVEFAICEWSAFYLSICKRRPAICAGIVRSVPLPCGEYSNLPVSW